MLTQKELIEAFKITKPAALLIVRLTNRSFSSEVEREKLDELCKDWLSQCYNRPSAHELIMYAIDKMINGYGVEAYDPGDWNDYPAYTYVNMGDTYKATVIQTLGKYIIWTIGDVIEQNELLSEG